MLYREIMAVCSEIHTKHINTLCGAERNTKSVGTYSDHYTANGTLWCAILYTDCLPFLCTSGAQSDHLEAPCKLIKHNVPAHSPPPQTPTGWRCVPRSQRNKTTLLTADPDGHAIGRTLYPLFVATQTNLLFIS